MTFTINPAPIPATREPLTLPVVFQVINAPLRFILWIFQHRISGASLFLTLPILPDVVDDAANNHRLNDGNTDDRLGVGSMGSELNSDRRNESDRDYSSKIWHDVFAPLLMKSTEEKPSWCGVVITASRRISISKNIPPYMF
ncbi:MAG: hypothetical protein LH679_07690 [Cyanobacteria bacterium CAN_BIN43]|nr:hypothetical protein [Cyanobacteria bacterium CAN_BIN43]